MPPWGSDAEGAMPVVASEKLALLADKALECASSVQTLLASAHWAFFQALPLDAV